MAVFLQPIYTQTVGAGGAASITFNNIPSSFTDLMIQSSFRSNRSNNVDDIYITINGSTSNFSGTYLQGNGSSASSGRLARYYGTCPAATATANTFSNDLLYIPNYSGSNSKQWIGDTVQETNGTLAYSSIIAGLWQNSSAINSISVAMTGSFVQYSTISLYGILRSGV